MHPYFAWQSTDIIEATFKNSTQYGFMPTSSNGNLLKRYKSPNPGANIPCLYDDLLTNSIYSNTPAINGGETVGQCFFGRRSKFNNGEKAKTAKSYLRALQACIQSGEHLIKSFVIMLTTNVASASLTIFGSYGFDYGRVKLSTSTKTNPNDVSKP